VKIAVVIPALDEAHDIAGAVRSASVPGAEVVVVDGGSSDETAERARAAGARVVVCTPGRARQLRRGVAETDGDPVLFLHADSRLPAGWPAAVAHALQDPAMAGGAFRLRFDERRIGLRVLEWGVRLRVALFSLPYGDQAIFVRRSVLDAVGGVPAVGFMEDLDLVRAVKTRGRLCGLPLPVTTSARRYRRDGIARTVLRHLLAALAWSAGVERSRIEGWVRR
jgi:rSAM/selenodomain-associated transferase 2